MEALRTQMDNLQWEVNRLEAENRMLRATDWEASERVDLELEIKQLKQDATEAAKELKSLKDILATKEADFVEEITSKEKELEELAAKLQQTEYELSSLRQQQSELHDERVTQLLEEIEQLQQTTERERENSELVRYRALEAERQKWESRETRIAAQLDKAMQQIAELQEQKITGESVRQQVKRNEALTMSTSTSTAISSPAASSDTSTEEMPNRDTEITRPVVTADASVHNNYGTSTPIPLLSQLPPITRFSGEEQPDGETFQDWLEQFESIAQLGGWNGGAKLVNLTTRLRGAAYSFYRSCTAEQRNNYKLLVEQLTKRFTPVQIQPIQSQLFHDRQQKPKETVDEYAEALRKLFVKAYANLARGGQEAESMGQSVLANQFVAGLKPGLKAKVVGNEGNLEQLLTRARFEEAKQKELAISNNNGNQRRSADQRDTVLPLSSRSSSTPFSENRTRKFGKSTTQMKGCFNCGLTTHLVKDCPYPKLPRKDREAHGGNPAIAMVTSEDERRKIMDQITKLQDELKEKQVNAVMEEATMYGVTFSEETMPTKLGPVVYSEVVVDGMKMNALIDTGSPVTLMSLKQAVQMLALRKGDFNSPQEWKKTMMARFQFKSPTVMLKSYSGDILNIVAQLPVTLTQGSHEVSSVVLIQQNAPVSLLIGTDLQPALGFRLTVQKSGNQETVLLGEDGGERSTAESLQESNTAVVKLLTATKVPAGHRKLVKARADGKLLEGLTLFTPKVVDSELRIADAAVQTDKEGCLKLIIENSGLSHLQLEEGMRLGTLENVEQVDTWEESVPKAVVSTIAASQSNREELLEKLNLQVEHLSPEQIAQLTKLITRYANVFALNSQELGTTSLVKHVIDTGGHPPVRQPVRRTPFALRNKVDEMVQEMLAQDVIQPSQSPWASPVVLVKKKDGGMRFCIDYRRLNQVTKLDVFPLPRIDDTLDLLSGAKYFTTLDLASGYWQVCMDPDSQEKTAFITYSGLYEFKKMPFGLVNAPATFQRLMEIVLTGLARDGCMVYLDDVLVIGRTFDEHNKNLTKVLERLRSAGLTLKPTKCKFAQLQVSYLGHVISEEGVQTDPAKLQAVKEFPVPTNVKALRSFLGLASYYRRFIPQFARIAGPLHTLTRKDVEFIWTPACQEAFERLRKLLASAPVLAYPDFKVPFILETDASIHGLGAVLAQIQGDGSVRPIAYASRSVQEHEKHYGVTELEGLGVVWAVKHFRPYLYGHQCDIYTDHEALKSLLNTPQPSGKLARWGMAIQELDARILHRSGKHNANADALSRAPVQQSKVEGEGSICETVAVIQPASELPALQRGDKELKEIIDFLESGILPSEEKQAKLITCTQSQYTLIDSVLYHVEQDGSLRVIPPVGTREELFHQAHGGVYGGHLGDKKVYSELQRHYWWPKMRSDINRWSQSCLTCATYGRGHSVRAPLTPIPVCGPFDRVGIDVIKFPRSTEGNQYAVVFMDYLTKWPEVFAVPNQTAATIAKLLVEEIVSRHGVPTEILSDRGKAFLSSLMKEIVKLLGIHQVNTTAYHPQTDGLVERFNRTLTAMLAKTTRKGRDWDKHLPYILFAYRASEQQSTQESPFLLLYGRDPRLPTKAALSPSRPRQQMDLHEYGAYVADKLATAWEFAQKNIKKAQHQQKKLYDQHARPPNFTVGERVFLFKPAERTGENRKLARAYHGPYRVIKLTPNNAHIRRVDKPEEELLLVAVDRLRRCPQEISDTFWPPDSPRKNTQTQTLKKLTTTNKPKVKNVGGQKGRRLRAAGLRRGDVKNS